MSCPARFTSGGASALGADALYLLLKLTMTEDINRKKELKKMELCESCAGIQRNWRRAPGHAELLQGDNRQEKRPHGLVTVTKYRCDRCGTAWEYENNKVDIHAGWSVVGR
jgi:hypothetical protein